MSRRRLQAFVDKLLVVLGGLQRLDQHPSNLRIRYDNAVIGRNKSGNDSVTSNLERWFEPTSLVRSSIPAKKIVILSYGIAKYGAIYGDTHVFLSPIETDRRGGPENGDALSRVLVFEKIDSDHTCNPCGAALGEIAVRLGVSLPAPETLPKPRMAS
jgi:hypothetical protein